MKKNMLHFIVFTLLIYFLKIAAANPTMRVNVFTTGQNVRNATKRKCPKLVNPPQIIRKHTNTEKQ